TSPRASPRSPARCVISARRSTDRARFARGARHRRDGTASKSRVGRFPARDAMATATHDEIPTQRAADEPDATKKKKKDSRRRVLIPLGIAVVLSVAVGYWMHERHFEDTDDAQIDGNITNVS